MRAANRYTTSKKPPINPIQFSALKPLDPLENEVEHGKDSESDRYVEQVEHPCPPADA
jgi:hypothetical protein